MSRRFRPPRKTRWVPVDQLRIDKRWAPPLDERGERLLAGVMRGELPSTVVRVRVADLRVADPPTLARVQAALREEPSVRASMAASLREERPCWIVYRDDQGRLVMFDDYAGYSVARELGIEWVDVKILGEG